MKNKNNYLLIAGASLLFSLAVWQNAFAQYPEDFTKDQADSTIKFRQNEIAGLKSDLAKAQDDAQKATTDAAQRMSDVTNCRDALYAMLGSDRNGYNAYREQIARDEQELASLRQLNPSQLGQSKAKMDALEADIRNLRSNKLVLIPDDMHRVQALSNGFIELKRSMNVAVENTNSTYTVGTWRKNRDCLWNIAKKPEIYNDPFAWPKIWHANKELIHNPDIIQPGWVLTISKSPVTQEDKDLTGYRHRHNQ